MWDLIVSVPDHCLSFFFVYSISIPSFDNIVTFNEFSCTFCFLIRHMLQCSIIKLVITKDYFIFYAQLQS